MKRISSLILIRNTLFTCIRILDCDPHNPTIWCLLNTSMCFSNFGFVIMCITIGSVWTEEGFQNSTLFMWKTGGHTTDTKETFICYHATTRSKIALIYFTKSLQRREWATAWYTLPTLLMLMCWIWALALEFRPLTSLISILTAS
jgi:ABC-type Fe3+-siderophore transport system permease subunit